MASARGVMSSNDSRAARGQSPLDGGRPAKKPKRKQADSTTEDSDSLQSAKAQAVDEDRKPPTRGAIIGQAVAVDDRQFYQERELLHVDAEWNNIYLVRGDITARGISIQDRLACGSNGCVYRVMLSNGAPAVFKVPVDIDEIERQELAHKVDIAPRVIGSFEVRTAKKMKPKSKKYNRDFPFRIVDTNERPDLVNYAVVMPLLTPLKKFHKDNPDMLGEVFAAYQAVEQTATAAGLMHTDWRPDNMVVDTNEPDNLRLYLIDWDSGFLKAGWAENPPNHWLVLDSVLQISWLLTKLDEDSVTKTLIGGMFVYLINWAMNQETPAAARETVFKAMRRKIVRAANINQMHKDPPLPRPLGKAANEAAKKRRELEIDRLKLFYKSRKDAIDRLVDLFNQKRQEIVPAAITRELDLETDELKFY